MDRRFVLSSETARALRRMLDAEKRGNEARPVAAGRGLGLMPFDCKLKTDPESGATRLLVCVSPLDAVSGGNSGASPVVLVTESGAERVLHYGFSVSAGWYDVGGITRGQTAYLIVCVSADDYQINGESAAFGTPISRFYVIRTVPAAPAGCRALSSVPVVPLCAWTDTGLRQYQRGDLVLWSTRVDSDISRGIRSGYEPDTRSIESGGGSYRRLYGFQSPEIIGNPYQGSSPPSDKNKILVLVRETNSAGDVAFLKYMSLADFAAGTDGAPDVPDPPGLAELLEDKEQRESIPCPTDGRSDVVYWNPCLDRWVSLRDYPDGAAAALSEHFWITGGNEETCYGSAIGGPDKVARMILPPTSAMPGSLIGDWYLRGWIQPFDGIRAGAGATRSLYEQTLSIDDGTSVKIAADQPPAPVAAAATVAALAARVAALESILNGITATPLTFPDGTRVNVLTIPN